MNIKKSTFTLLTLSLLLGSVTTQTMDDSNWLKRSLVFLSLGAASFHLFSKTKTMRTQKETQRIEEALKTHTRGAFEFCIPVQDIRDIICDYLAPEKEPEIIALTNCNGKEVPVVSITPLRDLVYSSWGFLILKHSGFLFHSSDDPNSFTNIFTPDKKLQHNTPYTKAKSKEHGDKFRAGEANDIFFTTRVYYNNDPKDHRMGIFLRSPR